MGRRDYYKEQKLKRLVYVFTITLIVSIVVFLTIFVMYNKKLKAESSQSLSNLNNINDIVSNDEFEETSYSQDATISSANNVTNEDTTIKTTTSKKNTTSNNTSVKNVENTTNSSIVENTNNTIVNEVVTEIVEELKFTAPVSGEILKDFATDTLVYSNTLEEWTVHNGIDIKADKTSIVVASEAGTIESIKNDPRYGLTITINHGQGFKTIYSNLLTTEFVTENEIVEKGQTIATVGETASFEVADEPHLHFEMYKEGELVNPTIYLNDI